MNLKVETNKMGKKCRVCGDIAFGFNFNGLSCESCKAFFRRNALKNKISDCKNKDDHCLIDLTSRKKCKKCRLSKCFKIGMKKELVLLNENRKTVPQFNKMDNNNNKTSNMKISLSNYEQEQIQQLQHCTAQLELKSDYEIVSNAESIIESANSAAIFIQKYVKFCKSICAFKSLNIDDQLVLLKGAYPEICAIWTAYLYDVKRDGVPVTLNENSDKAVFVSFGSLSAQLMNQNIAAIHKRYTFLMQKAIGKDSKIRDLLTVLLLFKIRPNIKSHEFIHYNQLVYEHLLKQYLAHKWKDPIKAKTKFDSLANLLNQIEPVRQSTAEFFESEIRANELTQICAEMFDLA